MIDPTLLTPSGILPESIADERYQALDRIFSRLGFVPVDVATVNAILGTATGELLYLLGRQFHMVGTEGWFLAETDEQKRDLIRNSIRLHKRRGAKWAVEYVLSILGLEGRIEEWWELSPPANPFNFTISIFLGDRPLDAELTRQLRELVWTHKNVRSWTLYIMERRSEGTIYTGAASISIVEGVSRPM